MTNQKATFEELVALLSQGIGQRTLYFADHPRVQDYANEFVAMLRVLLEREAADRFFLGFVEGNLVHNGKVMVGPTILGRCAIDLLQKLNSGGILFRAGLQKQEVLEIFEFATGLGDEVPTIEETTRILARRNVVHLEFSPAYGDQGWFGQHLFERDDAAGDPNSVEPGSGVPSKDNIVPVCRGLFDTVQSVHSLAASQSAFEIDQVRSISEQLVRSSRGSFNDVMQLVRYPDYDSFTVGHSVRVAMIAVLVAQRAGMPEEFLTELGTAGLLHDIGKAEVPSEILYKPGRLNKEEREVIKQHPVAGAQILLENQNAGPTAIAAAWGHHLRHDGGGYPAMEKWGFSSQITALLTVCDVFEAITAVRPYKGAQPPRRAYEIMLGDKGAFDPAAFKALVRAMGLYPPGSSILLSDESLATVLESSADIAAPIVKVTHRRGEELPAEDQETLNLSTQNAPEGLHVVELIEHPGSRSDDSEPESTEPDPMENLICEHDHSDDPGLDELLGKKS